MEKIPKNPQEETNFHLLHKERVELRKAAGELGNEGEIFEEHYRQPLEETTTKAADFKISDFGGLGGAKKFITAQKKLAEDALRENSGINWESILREAPDISKVRKLFEGLDKLRDFRIRRILEILNVNTTFTTRERNDAILKTIKEKIEFGEKRLAEFDYSVLRQTEILKYMEDLSKSGHICITPEVEKYLEAIGDRMLTGKPIFLHGPTGTGKTSLARFAASHFTGKDAEMVFCNPQTKESNVWGKTGIKPAKDGAIETVEIYGPLARAMAEGKVVIFDEFTALPKEQMVFIKGVFNAKVGDEINIVGNGIVEIRPGFQMIFTANLKSEKNPERQDLPPEIAREFEQNNLEIKYTQPAEAYDIMLARMLNRDGSLDMSFHDLNVTLPNLCRVMAEIQESYVNETDNGVARRSGAMDASGKVHSLKKFVMTQGSVEAVLSAWMIEKQTKKLERSFAEFLDVRFATALTFKEYSKEDRILAAKILASRGFLLTLTAQDLDLSQEIFEPNVIKKMRGQDAIEELQGKSGDIKHLSLQEIAELDPFGRRAQSLKDQAKGLLGAGSEGEKDQFLRNADSRMKKLFGEKRENASDLSATYTHPDGRQETITLSFEQKLQEFLDLYQGTGIDLPSNFENTARDIWERNHSEMEKAIQEKGFDEILIIPGNIPLPDLAEKMKMENGYFTDLLFDAGGGFAGVVSQNANKPRIILVHKTQNLKDRPELQQTLNIKGQDVNQNEALFLEDYLVFQKKYFKENQKHLDEDGWTWLSTKSGARLVGSGWGPGSRKLGVNAAALGNSDSRLGVRPSRCFF